MEFFFLNRFLRFGRNDNGVRGLFLVGYLPPAELEANRFGGRFAALFYFWIPAFAGMT
jgi:hypothetical protein